MKIKSFDLVLGFLVIIFVAIVVAAVVVPLSAPHKPSAGVNAVSALPTASPYFTGPEMTFTDVIVVETTGYGSHVEVLQERTLYVFNFTGATAPGVLKKGDRIDLTVQPVFDDHTFYFRHAMFLKRSGDVGKDDIQFILNTLTLTTPEETEQ